MAAATPSTDWLLRASASQSRSPSPSHREETFGEAGLT